MEVIDNGDASFSTIGDWTPYGGQGFQNDVHYTDAGTGAREARWTANVTPGQYHVAVTWSALYNRATNAPFTVRDGSMSLSTTALNQKSCARRIRRSGSRLEDSWHIHHHW